jgi:hypothetical protein
VAVKAERHEGASGEPEAADTEGMRWVGVSDTENVKPANQDEDRDRDGRLISV